MWLLRPGHKRLWGLHLGLSWVIHCRAGLVSMSWRHSGGAAKTSCCQSAPTSQVCKSAALTVDIPAPLKLSGEYSPSWYLGCSVQPEPLKLWATKVCCSFKPRCLFFSFNVYLFNFGCAESLLPCRISTGATSQLRCTSCSLWRLLLLQNMGSRAWGLQ